MVLKKFSQEDIFSWIIKDNIDLKRKYCSPLRADINPNCYFKYDQNGTLWFHDWGHYPYHYTCFMFYAQYYNISLQCVYDHIWNNIDDCSMYGIVTSYSKTQTKRIRNGNTTIDILTRDFTNDDIEYWNQYGIKKEHLEKDKVFSVKAIAISGENDFAFQTTSLCFAYTDFQEKRKKIYQPLEKSLKWFTNCNANDIGNINDLVENGYYLIITKSYKDCRVIRNLGYNCIWFQNEGMCPSNNILNSLSKRFKEIKIMFDNDNPGISAAKKIKEKISLFNENVKYFHLPENLLSKYKIKDASDFVTKYSYNQLNMFIKKNLEK